MSRIFGELVPPQNTCICGRNLWPTDSFCPGCGKAVNSVQPAATSRSEHGTGRDSHYQPQFPPVTVRHVFEKPIQQERSGLARLVRGIVWIVGLTFCGIFLLAFAGSFTTSFMKSFEKSYKDETSSKASLETPKSRQVSPKMRIFKVGQLIKVGYWTYKVNGVQYGDLMPSGYGRVERAHGKFVVVDITATNNDSSESTFPQVQLVGADGTIASETSAGSLSEGRLDWTTKLNPGLSTQGTVAFDVRPQFYVVKLTGGYESNENAYVALPPMKLASDTSADSTPVEADSATQ